MVGKPWSPTRRLDPNSAEGSLLAMWLDSAVAGDSGQRLSSKVHGQVRLQILLPCKEIVLWIRAPS